MLASICALAIHFKMAIADSMCWDPIVGYHIFKSNAALTSQSSPLLFLHYFFIFHVAPPR